MENFNITMSDPTSTGIPDLKDFPQDFQDTVASVSSALDLLVATESTPTPPTTITQAPTNPFINARNNETYAWIAATLDTLSWDPLTYKTTEFFHVFGSHFGNCRSIVGHPTYCSSIYTSCSDGTLFGPKTIQTCIASGYGSTPHAGFSTCVTDLYFTTYGAENALSRIRCGPAYDRVFTTPDAMTMYRESPTIPVPESLRPTGPVKSPSMCDAHGRPCPGSEPYRMNDGVKAAIAVCVFMALMAIALAIFFFRKRKLDKRRAAMDRIANNYALEEMDADGVKPPKYNVAVAEERGEGSSSGHVPTPEPASAVPKTDPPPYRP